MSCARRLIAEVREVLGPLGGSDSGICDIADVSGDVVEICRPEVDAAVFTGGREDIAVRAEFQRGDLGSVTSEGGTLLRAAGVSDVPDLSFRAIGRSKGYFVGAEHHRGAGVTVLTVSLC